MRFDIALLAMVALTCGSLLAATPSVVFAANRNAVLSGECVEADGISFGVGIASPRADSARSKSAALEKAKLAAKANLIVRRAIGAIVWPDDVDADRRLEIAKIIGPLASAKAQVTGLESVHSSVDANGRSTVVVAVPSGNISGVKALTYADALKLFEESKRRAQTLETQPTEPQKDNVQKSESANGKDGDNDGAVVDESEQVKFILPKGVSASENETIGF